jgi:WhiB family redox-sensing transcriptional regulator
LPWAGPNVMSMLVGPEWARDAACKDLSPEQADAFFFPQRGGSAKAGRALCRRCPVAQECLELALSQGEAFGIWGGTSERERRVLRREMETSRKRRHHKPHKTVFLLRDRV